MNMNKLERKWVPNIKLDNYNTSKLIRVTSYNILADSLIENSTQYYKEIISTHFNWDKRRTQILNELNSLNSDIICLQEFEDDKKFIIKMEENGYNCAYKMRTGSNMEGCSIFWKYDKFEFENVYAIEFNSNTKSFIYDRDNVCLFTLLRLKSDRNILFIVANTHILFNLNRGDIKIAQVYQILNTIAYLKNIYSNDKNVNNDNNRKDNFNDISIDNKYTKIISFLCGDFNAIPSSPLYNLITTGEISNCKKLNIKRLSGQYQGFLKSYRLNINSNYNFFKSNLMRNMTTKYSDNNNNSNNCSNNYNNNISYNIDNENDNLYWITELKEYNVKIINNILQLKLSNKIQENTEINIENYNKLNKSTQQDDNYTIKCLISLKSSYSQNFKNILDNYSKGKFDQYTNINNNYTDKNYNIDIYGIKMSKSNIDGTSKFTQNLCLEPSFSFYGRESMAKVDYIFYNGDVEVIRSLDNPEIYSLMNSYDSLPNSEFPSDHILLSSDFYLK